MTELNTAEKDYEMKDEKLEALKEMCQTDLEGRIEIMAGVTQEFILSGCESPFIAAVIKDEYFVFLPTYEIRGDDHKEFLKQRVLDLAIERDADCIVICGAVWIAPNAVNHRPSLHPLRQEMLLVIAKDHSRQLFGCEKIFRHGDEIMFGDLQILDAGYSWLDDFPAANTKVTAN